MQYGRKATRPRLAAGFIFASIGIAGMAGSAAAGSFSEYLFPGPTNTGPYAPSSGAVVDTRGNLWGTTTAGGANLNDGGTIFELTPPSPGQQDWNSDGYFSFSPDTETGFYTDGNGPLALTYDGLDAGRPWDATSPLYGWTGAGGSNSDGRNVLFAYGLCGLAVLHTFTDFAAGNGGFDPKGLTLGPDGALYGVIDVGPTTTDSGGVFRLVLTRNGCGVRSYRVIYSFSDGKSPTGGMTFGPDGALYLAASNSIFRLQQDPDKPARWKRSLVYAFAESNHGPGRRIVFGMDGALYGADAGNGDTVPGTIYRVRSHVNKKGKTVWVRDTLYSFAAEDKEGNNPVGVFFGPNGVLYGITSDNHGGGYGTVFKVTPQPGSPNSLPWNMTVLHAFAGTDGSRPTGTLAFGSNGAIYGSTVFGSPTYPSDYSHGYAFELVP